LIDNFRLNENCQSNSVQGTDTVSNNSRNSRSTIVFKISSEMSTTQIKACEKEIKDIIFYILTKCYIYDGFCKSKDQGYTNLDDLIQQSVVKLDNFMQQNIETFQELDTLKIHDYDEYQIQQEDVQFETDDLLLELFPILNNQSRSSKFKEISKIFFKDCINLYKFYKN
jgi:hypothetical protein